MEQVIVRLEEDYYTTAHARDHIWHADLEEPAGGSNGAPTPEEMLLGALGSCMAQTAKLYATRKGWQIDRIEVHLSLERFSAKDYDAYEGDSTFIHEIRERISIEGPLDADQEARIREIMAKCPVRRVLASPSFFVPAEKITE